MDDENLRELDDELDELPAQDVVNDDDYDDDDNDDDGVAYEDYDLIGVPGQVNPKPMPANSSDEEEEQNEQEQLEDEQNDEQLEDQEEEQNDEQQEEEQMEDDQDQQDLEEEDDEAREGVDLNAIEIVSSEVDGESPVDGESESDEEKPTEGGRTTATVDDDSSADDDDDDDQEDVRRGNDSSSSEENNLQFSSSEESDDGLERSFEELLARPYKKHGELVQLGEIAFKLNDLNKIELALEILQNSASVPAHIWVKYLKARLVVTQTPDEIKEFEEKCAMALGSHYNLTLADYIVGYLEDHQENQNHVLWAKLMADYDVERPDFGQRLTANFLQQANETEISEFNELMRKHCVTWKISAAERDTINAVVSEFKDRLEKIKMVQRPTFDWGKVPRALLYRTLCLEDLSEDIKNAVLRFMFEKIVAKFPIVDTLWFSYIQFSEGAADNPKNPKETEEEKKKGKNAKLDAAVAAAKRASRVGKGYLLSTSIDIAKRGIRCRPSVILHHKLLDLMERDQSCDQRAVSAQMRSMLKPMEFEASMTVELYLDYLAFRIRNTNFNEEDAVARLRATFSQAWDDLSEKFGDSADTDYEILQLWALVEYALMRCPDAAMNIWHRILDYPGSKQRGMLWLAFAEMEHTYNNGYATRTILNEALSQPVLMDGLKVLQYSRRLERCFGNYQTIAACQAIQLPQEFLPRDPEAPPPRQYYRRQLPQQQQQATPRQNRPQEQAPPRQNRPQQQAPPRQNRPQQQAPPQRSQQQPQQAQDPAQDPAQPTVNRQERRRQAHAKMLGKKQEQDVPKEEPATQEGPTTKASAEAPRQSHLKYSASLETNKVFVRNLHPACAKEELQQLFTPFGHVKDVRVVLKQMQKRGIAYIEYEKPEEAQQAVKERNGYELRGLPLFVAISNPPPKTKPPESTADGGKTNAAPKKRVFTSLIPTSVVRQEVAAVAAKKRRIELAQDEDEDDPQPSTSSSNGRAAPATAESAQKSNDDFRKLFFKAE